MSEDSLLEFSTVSRLLFEVLCKWNAGATSRGGGALTASAILSKFIPPWREGCVKRGNGVNPVDREAFFQSYATKHPPALRHTPRHGIFNHAGSFVLPRKTCFERIEERKDKKNHTAPFPSSEAVTALCALLLSAARKSFHPLWLRTSSGSPTLTSDPPISCVKPPQNKSHPLNVTAARKYPPRQDKVWRRA